MAKKLRPEDLWQLRMPMGLAVSPDGGRVAYVMDQADPDAGRWISHVHVSNLTGREANPVQVTRVGGRNVEPRWWPDFLESAAPLDWVATSRAKALEFRNQAVVDLAASLGTEAPHNARLLEEYAAN